MSPGLELTRVFNSEFTQTRPYFQNIGNSGLGLDSIVMTSKKLETHSFKLEFTQIRQKWAEFFDFHLKFNKNQRENAQFMFIS